MREVDQSATSGTQRPDSVFMSQEQIETRELATLLEIGRTLAGTHELKAALGLALKALVRHHGMLRGLLMLSDAKTGELCLVASHGMGEGVERRGVYRLGEGITGRVAQTGKPIIVPRIS